MSIKVQCPQCQLVAAAPEGHAGRHVRCKRRNAKFPLPTASRRCPRAGAVGRAPVLPESPTVIDRYEVRNCWVRVPLAPSTGRMTHAWARGRPEGAAN